MWIALGIVSYAILGIATGMTLTYFHPRNMDLSESPLVLFCTVGWPVAWVVIALWKCLFKPWSNVYDLGMLRQDRLRQEEREREVLEREVARELEKLS